MTYKIVELETDHNHIELRRKGHGIEQQEVQEQTQAYSQLSYKMEMVFNELCIDRMFCKYDI